MPGKVRERPGLKPGDTVRYALHESRAEIERAERAGAGDPFLIFTEWAGKADEAAYAGSPTRSAPPSRRPFRRQWPSSSR
jgi:hypothetical protein